jgi:hypothetical protein
LCLERLAQKVRADKAWSRPLKDLSKSAYRYNELLLHCRGLLDSGSALQSARGRKRARRIVVLATVIVVLVIAGGGGSWFFFHLRGARQRVDALLGKAETCAIQDVAEADLDLASEEQKQAVAKRRKQCEDEQERERQAAAEQKRKAEEAKKQAAEKAEREDKCAQLVAALQAGELGPDHLATAGDSAQLLQRVVALQLTGSDLAPPAPKLPCTDTPSSDEIEAAFAKAVVASTGVWLAAEDLSEPVRKILTDHATQIRDRSKLLFGLNAETRAQRALVSGDPKAVERALRLCALKRSLEIVRGPYCDALATSTGKGT